MKYIVVSDNKRHMVAVRCIGSVYRVVVTCFSETQAQTVADAMNQCAAKP